MPFDAGTIYHAPDGRRLRAEREHRRYDDQEGWALVPVESDEQNLSWRDRLSRIIFLEHGKLVYFDFSGLLPRANDTGWRVADLVPEKAG